MVKDNSEIFNILKSFKKSLSKDILTDSHSKEIEIIAKGLKSEEYNLRDAAQQVFLTHSWIASYLGNEVKNFREEEIFTVFFYLINDFVFLNLPILDKKDFIAPIDPKILSVLPSKLIDMFIDYLESIDYDPQKMIDSIFLYSFCKEIPLESKFLDFKNNIKKLLDLKVPLLVIILLDDNGLDYFSWEEKIALLSEYSMVELSTALIQKLNLGEWEDTILENILDLGDIGVEIILQLPPFDELKDRDYLEGFINDNFDSFRQGIIEKLIELDYPKFKNYFYLEGITNLSSEDIQEIVKESSSKFFKKMNLLFDDKKFYDYTDNIDHILSFVREEGFNLKFNYLKKLEGSQLIHAKKVFGKCKKNAIEPIIKEFVLNIHVHEDNFDYEYEYETLNYFYNCIFDIFSDIQLKQFIFSGEYDLLKNSEKIHPYFFV